MIRSLLPLLILMACGGGTLNPNSAFITTHDKHRVDVLLQRAQVEYDRGNLASAENHAKEAYNINSNNKDAALQLANINIAKAKLSLLDIAGKISKRLTVDSGTTSNTQAVDVLGVLGDVVGITDGDYALLGTVRDNTDPVITPFDKLDVVEPLAPGSHTNPSSPRYKVEVLRRLGEAIAYLCPYVPESVTQGSTDSRDLCSKVSGSTSVNQAQVLFAFGMAHLFEAVFFNDVLMYSNAETNTTTGSSAISNSNLFQRVKAIENIQFSISTATTYLAAVKEVVRNITSIFNSGDTSSMLTATMIDIRLTQQSLTAIEGFPTNLLAKIKDVQTTLDAAVAKAGQSSSNITNQTKALNDQLSATVIAKLNASITKYIASVPAGQSSTAQVQAICDQYKSITGFLNASTAPTITACQ